MTSPQRLDGLYTTGFYLNVGDVDAFCDRIRKAGATISRDPRDEDYGHRSAGARDLEGHPWWFYHVLPNAEGGS